MDSVSTFRLLCSIIFGLGTIYLLVKPSANGKYNIANKVWVAIFGVVLTVSAYDGSQPKEIKYKNNYNSLPSQSGSGMCDYDWQKAKDGSKCGDRAANKKSGGN